MLPELNESLKLLRQASRTIKKIETPLPKQTIRQILKLQDQVIELRNQSIHLQREQGHTLQEVADRFEISPSRVSQIHRGVKMNKTRRAHSGGV